MKKINIFLLFLAFSVNLIIADEARSEPKDKHILKWGTIMPAMGVWNETLERIRDMIEEQTGGGIKNIWYYGGVMGDEDDMIRKVRLGQLHGLIILVGGLQRVAPESVVFSLPFFLKNSQEVDCFYSRAWHLVEEVFAKHGYVALGYTHAGSAKLQAKITPNEIRELFQGKRQYIVKDPTEMNKLFKQFKLWFWPVTKEYTDYLLRVFPDFGGLIPLQLMDVLTGMQTGMINLAYGMCYTTLAFQWQTQVNYLFGFEGYSGFGDAPGIVLIDQKTFSSLPASYQKIIRAAFQAEFGPKSNQFSSVLRKDEAVACRELIKRGWGEVTFSSEATKVLEEKAEKLYRDMAGEVYPLELLKQVMSFRDRCRQDLKSGVHEKGPNP